MAVITRESGRRRRIFRRATWSLVIAPLAIIFFALACVFGAELLYADRALPGLTVAGLDVGSLDRASVDDRLQTQLQVQTPSLSYYFTSVG